MSLEIMKQALDALGAYMEATDSEQDEKAHNLMATVFFKLKEAIEQAEKRQWIDLTSDEIWEVYKKHDSLQYMAFARAIEKALKEKNT